MLESIRVLRGLAALLVVVYHSFEYVSLHGQPFAKGLFNFGAVGVDVFFLLSGFVMAYSMGSDGAYESKLSSGIDFMVKRIIRVAPMYWIGASISICLFQAMPGRFRFFSTSWGHYFESILFLPHGDEWLIRPILSQGWTLYHEMYFYLVLAIGIVLFGRKISPIFASAFILMFSALGAVDVTAGHIVWPMLVASPMNAEFVMGALICYVFKSDSRIAMVAMAIVGLTLSIFGSGDYSLERSWRRVFAWGGGATVAFVLALSAESAIRGFSKWGGRWLGDISYSLYIFHGFSFSAVDLLVSPIFPAQAMGVRVLGLVFGSLISAWVIYSLIEQPLTMRLNGLWRGFPLGKKALLVGH
jgi:exopolysaccharide production protein ExoZ